MGRWEVVGKPSSNKFRGGEMDTRTAGRRGEWSKESGESAERREGAKLVRSTDKTGKIRSSCVVNSSPST